MDTLSGEVTKLNLSPFWKEIYFKTIGKHAYSNMPKILPPKNENFQLKKSDIFSYSAQNKDCGYSLEPPWQVPTIYVFEQK